MKIAISKNLTIEDAPAPLFGEIKTRLTIQNPAYQEALKMGRWLGRTPELLRFFEHTPNGLTIPRGFIGQLLALCDRQGITPEIEDRRRTLPEVDISFNGQLRDFQETALSDILARDLLPAQRLKIIQWLYDQSVITAATRKTKEIAEGSNLPTTTAKMVCEDLMIVGVLDRDVEDIDKETSPYQWRIAEGFHKFIQSSGVLDIGEVPDDVPF